MECIFFKNHSTIQVLNQVLSNSTFYLFATSTFAFLYSMCISKLVLQFSQVKKKMAKDKSCLSYHNLLVYPPLFIVCLFSSQLLLYYNFLSKKAKTTKDLLNKLVPAIDILITTSFTLQYLQVKKQKAGHFIIIC